MKIKIILGSIFFFGILSWLLWPTPTPLPATQGSTIILFGDSLAYGTGSSEGFDIASQLSTQLGQPVLNFGVPGDTTADGLARLKSVLDADPRVVIILLGGNDALQKVPTETTFNNLTQIITIIQSAGAAVVLVGEPGGLFNNQYEKEYERLAEEYRLFYVPNILAGLITKPEYMSDYIHPNDTGYTIATQKILPAAQAALR